MPDTPPTDHDNVAGPLQVQLGACSLGQVLVGHRGRGLCVALIDDDRAVLLDDVRHRFPDRTIVEAADATGQSLLARVCAAIDTPRAAADDTAAVIVDEDGMPGTPFQRRVWVALRTIPPGRTITYTELATSLGLPSTSSRAVATACAANPVAVVVPCHRVVRGDGSLAGYRWGLDRKRTLLLREAGPRVGELF